MNVRIFGLLVLLVGLSVIGFAFVRQRLLDEEASKASVSAVLSLGTARMAEYSETGKDLRAGARALNTWLAIGAVIAALGLAVSLSARRRASPKLLEEAERYGITQQAGAFVYRGIRYPSLAAAVRHAQTESLAKLG